MSLDQCCVSMVLRRPTIHLSTYFICFSLAWASTDQVLYCAEDHKAAISENAISRFSDGELQSFVVSLLKARTDVASNLRVVSETHNWEGKGENPTSDHWIQQYDHRQLGDSYRVDVTIRRVRPDGTDIEPPTK